MTPSTMSLPCRLVRSVLPLLLAVTACEGDPPSTEADAPLASASASGSGQAVVENLRALGVRAEELADGMVIEGSDQPLAGRVACRGDHRIAMAFGVLGALPGNTIDIDEPEAADVSFPGFWGLLSEAAGDHRV